jgi:hypothetical protein
VTPEQPESVEGRLIAAAAWIFLVGDPEPWDVLEDGIGDLRTLRRRETGGERYVTTRGSFEMIALLDHWMGRDLEPRRAYILTPVTA